MSELVKFHPLSEEWGLYRLPDGVHFIGRTALTGLLAEPGQDGYEVRLKNLVEGFAPEGLKADPTGGPAPDLARETPAQAYDEADIQTLVPSESVYKLATGQLMRVRYVPQQVKRYSIYNSHREPVLWIDARQTVLMEPSFDEIETLHSKPNDQKAAATGED